VYLTYFAGNNSVGYTGENMPALETEIDPRQMW
jgi:hypothetical protein